MLPFEGHGYQARESVYHVLAEMIDWLDRHVKNAPASSGDEDIEDEDFAFAPADAPAR
jgi:hypothetical protein